jgi:hypothetical protein
MKIKLILKIAGSFMLILSLFMISSCSKSAYKNVSVEQTEENSEEALIEEKDFTESDEDLLTVDYKDFYDQLSGHGEWIQVRPVEIGLDPITAQIHPESTDENNFSLNNILGVKEANAADVNESMVFVWKPSVDLGVSVSGEAPVFKPYTNGQWINTDAGWYFKAPTPVEETVSHYGRWVNSPTAGWLWVPGRVWAPAWVDWKENEEYVSWAPLPPSAYVVNNSINQQIINDKDYVIIEKKYFLKPAVYKYQTISNNDENTILMKDMTATDGIVVINNILTNLGPDVAIMQNIYGRSIEFIKLHHVKNYKEVIYSNGEYYVYSPSFKKFKNKGNKRVMVVPKSYKEYDDWVVKNYDEKNSKNDDKYENKNKNSGNDNSSDNNNGNNGDNNKDNNGNKNKEKNNDVKSGKNNGDKQNGNDNDDKNKGDKNGSKNNDKEKGNKNNGKNDGKGKK